MLLDPRLVSYKTDIANRKPEMSTKCTFVIGSESSGSTYIARVLHRCLVGGEWSGRGWNCCDVWNCDAKSNFLHPHKMVDNLICHRSLPFGPHEDLNWPNIEGWLANYDAKFLLCTRDRSLSEQSRRVRWGTDRDYAKDTDLAVSVMKDLMRELPERTYIFNYESFMLLGDAYLDLAYDFLEIEERYYPDDLADANPPHVGQTMEMKRQSYTKGLKNVVKPLLRRSD